jgi:formate dehydrogenase major subunit
LVGQEPGWDSPFNLGSHCAKGSAVRELGHGERRLKYPMKLVNGTYTRVSWEQAINEIGDQMLKIRDESGPDSVYWLGSAKTNNEQSYLYRKFAAYWGTNNVDHQARICHSTTVAGVANTWGYGAMTNSYNDIHNSKAIFLIGGNPAEAHPVSLQHIMKAKEQNNAPVIVCDPRFTRTAAHADEYVRFRPGTDVALIWGILWHIFENGWEDKEFIRTRVWGMDDIKTEVAK